MKVARRKKDFKLREDIVREFEAYAPNGQQTSIVEGLIANWVVEQKKKASDVEVRRAYERAGKKRR